MNALKRDNRLTALRSPGFNVRAVEAFEPVEADDLSRFEGEGGLAAPVPAAEWIEVSLEHGIWRRHRPAADQMIPAGS